MPIHWTISHPNRLVVAVAKETVRLKDIEDYLDGVIVNDAIGYRKIFDTTNGEPDLSDDDMMQLGARIRAYASTAKLGPLAIVAASPQSYERARMFSALADASRPIQIFPELHAARKWLDAQLDS
jgi:hypothetical protein